VSGADSRIDGLADLLADRGQLTDERWRRVLHQAPRHLFAPSRGYAVPGSPGGPTERIIDRQADEAGWWDGVYADMAIITQRDDGAGDPASPQGLATCSLSAPGVVVPFLELLDPRPGQAVLEIGTGTGWTAGLLCAAIGQDSVTTIEIAASSAISFSAGHSVTAVHGQRVTQPRRMPPAMRVRSSSPLTW
jgi:protein-L-isoaspartate O-methyltransferase